MRPFPRPLLTLAQQRHGLVTAAELTKHGVLGRTRSATLESGLVVPVHRGVYRLGSHAESFEQRCLAACLAAPDACLSGPTAGRIWGLRKVRTDDVHLLARRRIHLLGVTAHRSDVFGPDDVTERGGLRLLRPVRLACDLAWFLSDPDLESVFEQMIDRRLAMVPALRAAARRFCGCGRPGSERLARVLESRPVWLKPADSDLEVQVRRGLAAAGFEFERQVPVVLDSGVTVHLDLADRAIKLGIEVDHVTWHGGRLDAQRDKGRDRGLARLGWTICRVTDDDVLNRYAATIAELVEIVRSRSEEW